MKSGTLHCGMIALAFLGGCSQKPYRLKSLRNLVPTPYAEIFEEDDLCKTYKHAGKDLYGAAPTMEIVRVRNTKSELYRLGFIEVDDQGQFWSRQQMDQVLDDMENVVGDEGAILIAYVHGWNHNARVCDSNVRQFRKLLSWFARDEADRAAKQSSDAKPRRVLGIYLGWRGRSGKKANYLSFGERKRSSHRVGDGAGIELLTRIAALDLRLKTKNNNSRMITIGHSLGAAVVNSAIHARVEYVIMELAGISKRKQLSSNNPVLLGDLVVFLNPAFEAARFRQMAQLSATLDEYKSNPLIVSVATAADDVTKTAFPMAMREWYKKGLFREDEDQFEQFIRSFGNYKPYRTHTVEKEDLIDCPKPKEQVYRFQDFVQSEDPDDDAKQIEAALDKADDRTKPERCVRAEALGGPYLPYMSIYDSTGKLMTGHNNQFNWNTVNLLRQLLERFGTLEQGASPTLQLIMPQTPPVDHTAPREIHTVPEPAKEEAF